MEVVGYQYHVFVSYRHLTKVEEWVGESFIKELDAYLIDELDGDPPRIFWDRKGIRTGTRWRQKIPNSLKGSCCLIAVWAPSYFRSSWCRAELGSFLKREETVPGIVDDGLILPVLWNQNLPKDTPEIDSYDFTEFTFTGKGFKQSEAYYHFQRQMRAFAEDVGEAVRRAPQFQPDWPVVTPEEILEEYPEIKEEDEEKPPVPPVGSVKRPILKG